ncbi:unnamed protein product [Allacma fusca]|uniref:Pyridoxal 5'-phosphate synthase n=1 Tax=Allacma fusca TaxID=39272 RepID=A0A8J2JTR0_9HEXA|nr:unnamed protein product [Allacma fusca]
METITLETKNPMELFKSWYAEAKSCQDNLMPERMTLGTMGKDGFPNARTVILRGLDDAGFKMYWNKHSQKSQELEINNRASLVLVWIYRTLEGALGFRQVRVQGRVEDLPQSEVDAYFESEPDIAKVRAIVQIQSRVITDEQREEIRRKFEELCTQVQENHIKLECPQGYVGCFLRPSMIEFYQGQRDTVNDRVRFRLDDGNSCCSEATLPGDDGWKSENKEEVNRSVKHNFDNCQNQPFINKIRRPNPEF